MALQCLMLLTGLVVGGMSKSTESKVGNPVPSGKLKPLHRQWIFTPQKFQSLNLGFADVSLTQVESPWSLLLGLD